MKMIHTDMKIASAYDMPHLKDIVTPLNAF